MVTKVLPRYFVCQMEEGHPLSPRCILGGVFWQTGSRALVEGLNQQTLESLGGLEAQGPVFGVSPSPFWLPVFMLPYASLSLAR